MENKYILTAYFGQIFAVWLQFVQQISFSGQIATTSTIFVLQIFFAGQIHPFITEFVLNSLPEKLTIPPLIQEKAHFI
jgi:hypothetical protein